MRNYFYNNNQHIFCVRRFNINTFVADHTVRRCTHQAAYAARRENGTADSEASIFVIVFLLPTCNVILNSY